MSACTVVSYRNEYMKRHSAQKRGRERTGEEGTPYRQQRTKRKTRKQKNLKTKKRKQETETQINKKNRNKKYHFNQILF